MRKWLWNLLSKYKQGREFSKKHHITSIVYLIAILMVLCVALMYTELLNNSVFVDMPGVGKLLRMPRVNAVLGTLGSWLGVPNMNDALLLVIIGCILLLVVIFILKVMVGGVINWLFLLLLSFIGRVCYKAMLNYNSAADMLYENNLLGIHIMRILGETERLDVVNKAINAFFNKYETNEGVLLTNVTPGDITYLLEHTAVLHTKEQIAQAVYEYMKNTHINFESYPSLQQELAQTNWEYVWEVGNTWGWNVLSWCGNHPYITATAITTICVVVWYSQSGGYGGSINNLATGIGDNLTNTNTVIDNSTTATTAVHNKMLDGMDNVLSAIQTNKQEFSAQLQQQKDVVNNLQQGLHEAKGEIIENFHLISSYEAKINVLFTQMKNLDDRFQALEAVFKLIITNRK